MREVAQVRGMKVLTPEQLASRSTQFSGIIASYVLHLTIVPEELLAAVSCLTIGSRFSANFHKGINVAEVESLLRTSRLLAAVPVPESTDHCGHGEIRLWRRCDE